MAVKPTSAPAHQPPDLSSLCLAITEHAPLAMATVEGASDIVRYVNPAFCRLMDKPMEQLVGKPFREMLPEKDECVALLDRVFRTGKPESHTEQQHSKPNPVFWSYTMWPVLADERPVGVMIQVTETAQFHEKTLAMNEALMLGSVRQHELTEASDNLNAQLRTEITERKQAETALKESQERYRVLFSALPVAAFVCDRHGTIQYYNPRATELWQREPKVDVDQHCGSIKLYLKDGTVLPHAQSPMMEVMRTGIPARNVEVFIERPDGSRIPVIVNFAALKNAQGEIVGAVTSFDDISERKKTEQELSEKARLLDLSNDAIIVHDLDDKISSWNKGAEELYGWTSEEVMGEHLDSLLQMEFPKPMEEIVTQLQSEGHFSGEVVQVARDGRRVAALCRWVLDRGTKSILTSYTDITERKRNEEAVREAGERFRFLAESMPQKIFTATATGDVDYFNREWTEFTGLPIERIRDWGWLQLIHPEDVDENIRRWQHSIDTQEPFYMEHRFLRLDGAYRWHVSRALPMRDVQGNVTMWIGSNTDIEDQKRIEEALRESETRIRALFETAEAARVSAEAAKMRAEAATRAKDAFLAALSHELRTPLNPALLLASALADDAELSPRVRGDIDIIGQAIALQAQLVDDLLDITRITGGKLRLDLHPLNAHTALRHACEVLAGEAEDRHVEITLDLVAPLYSIEADVVRMQQIFWNVLKNAVKFTAPGGAITVRTWNPPGEDTLLIEIADTGVGIEPEMLGNIFDAFAQEQHADARRFGGLGLGLAIVRNLVELQHGRIRARSPGRDQGATFSIELPLSAVVALPERDSTPPAAPAAPKQPPRHILLVEDHELTRTTLARLLQRRGHHVAVAATAAQARELASTCECDLIISDLGLPDGDGHTLLVELCDAHDLPAIALSGYGMDEDRERSRKSGFFVHLTKPIDIHALEAAIAMAPQLGSA